MRPSRFIRRFGSPEAQQAYQRILSRSPDQPDALHLLGLLHVQTGQPESAVDLIRRAIAVRPDAGEYHLTLCAALMQQGDHASAKGR